MSELASSMEDASMHGEGPHDRGWLREQVRAQLDHLKGAGIDWLPASNENVSLANVSLATVTHVEDSTPEPVSIRTVEAATTSSSCATTFDDRRQALQVLASEVATCTRCPELACTRTQIVFGQGGPGVELCFIGEAPGADEDAQGLPFVGAAGQLLNRIIASCGLKREEVYICNILKCRPPGNRTPLPHEAGNCRAFLDRQLGLVQPRFICALGGCAAQNLLNSNVPLGRLRGRFHDYKGIPVLCTYHPAYLLPHRNPDKKRDVWEDMKMLLAKMGRAIPQKS
jgi:DNA polymerase